MAGCLWTWHGCLIGTLGRHVAVLTACLADNRSDKERGRGDRAVWAADPDGGTVGTIAGAAAQASYAFDTVLGEGVSNAEVRSAAHLCGRAQLCSCCAGSTDHTMRPYSPRWARAAMACVMAWSTC